MKSSPTSSKAYSLIVAFLIILTVCAIHPVNAQDLTGGTTRTDLSGGSGTAKPPRRPKVRTTSTPVDRTVKRPIAKVVTLNTGALAVAAESGAAILVEPLAGGEALEAVVEKDERGCVFINLKPGRYRVATELDGFIPTEKEVIIVANRPAFVTLNLQPITHTVTITTNTPKGEVRYVEVISDRVPATGETKYTATGDTRIVSIVNGRAVLSSLRLGTYGIDVRAGEIGYKTLLATFTLPGKTSFEIALERMVVSP